MDRLKKFFTSLLSFKIFLLIDLFLANIILLMLFVAWGTERILHLLVPIDEIWSKPYEPVIGSKEYAPLTTNEE